MSCEASTERPRQFPTDVCAPPRFPYRMFWFPQSNPRTAGGLNNPLLIWTTAQLLKMERGGRGRFLSTTAVGLRVPPNACCTASPPPVLGCDAPPNTSNVCYRKSCTKKTQKYSPLRTPPLALFTPLSHPCSAQSRHPHTLSLRRFRVPSGKSMLVDACVALRRCCDSWTGKVERSCQLAEALGLEREGIEKRGSASAIKRKVTLHSQGANIGPELP